MSSILSGSVATLEPLPVQTLEQTNGAVTIPGAHTEDSALTLLTDERKPLAAKMVCILAEEATRRGIANRITLSRHVDSENGSIWLSIRQNVDMVAEQALDYWEEVGLEIEKWIATLTPAQADIAYDEFFTRIDWNPK